MYISIKSGQNRKSVLEEKPKYI